jgi:hypothetical protein
MRTAATPQNVRMLLLGAVMAFIGHRLVGQVENSDHLPRKPVKVLAIRPTDGYKDKVFTEDEFLTIQLAPETVPTGNVKVFVRVFTADEVKRASSPNNLKHKDGCLLIRCEHSRQARIEASELRLFETGKDWGDGSLQTGNQVRRFYFVVTDEGGPDVNWRFVWIDDKFFQGYLSAGFLVQIQAGGPPVQVIPTVCCETLPKFIFPQGPLPNQSNQSKPAPPHNCLVQAKAKAGSGDDQAKMKSRPGDISEEAKILATFRPCFSSE